MKDWTRLASDEQIQRTIDALKINGINAIVVENAEKAKEKVIELLPQGAEVINMTSVTLDAIGIPQEINESGKYDSVRKKLMSMDRKTQGLEMQKLGAAPEWVVGSVHAVTENGEIMIVSNTGSQLGPYAYTAAHVIWVVGTQKIVKDIDEAVKRIYEHCLPLESKRAKIAYGMEKSNVSKKLIINKETTPGRITLIFVNQLLGF